MSSGGKGDSPRPFSVPLKEFDAKWDAIFRPKKIDSTQSPQKEVDTNESRAESNNGKN